MQAIRLGVYSVLARLSVGPADFGLVNMCVVLTAFAHILIDFGFTNALIQKKDATDTDYCSVFWFNLSVCTVISALLLTSAAAIATFYEAPRLRPVIFAMSPIYIIYGITSIQKMALRKTLSYRTISLIELTGTLGGSILAVAVALAEHGVWSLIAFHVFTQCIASLLYWLRSNAWRPSKKFSFQSLRNLSPFSLTLLANNSLNYWARNTDKVFVGKFLGETDLGFYSQAYGLVLIPVSNFSNTFSNVLFPLFSRMNDRAARIDTIFTKVSKTVLLVNLPIFLLLNINAGNVIAILLGDHWEQTANLLQIFSFSGLIMSVRSIHSSVFMSENKIGKMLIINLVLRTIMIAGFFFVVKLGSEAMAVWFLINTALSFGATSFASCQIMKVSFARFLDSHWKIVAAGTVAFLFANHFNYTNNANLFSLICNVGLFLTSYAGMLVCTREQLLTDLTLSLARKCRWM